jgi:hypothetical protein
MTIQVEISPETEAWLAAEAAAQRMEISAFAASLIEQAKRPPAPGSHNLGRPPKRDRADGEKSLALLFAESPLRGLDLSFESDRDIGRDASL